MNETAIIEAALGGDRSAQGALVDAYSGEAMRLALHLAGDRSDAEDAVQTAFVKALSNLHRFDRSRPFRPWFMRIVANECRKQLRDAAFRWRFWQTQRAPDADEATTECAVMVRLEHQALYEALRALRPDDRALLALSYFEGWSEAELADMFEIPRGTVKSRKHAAMARLRERLDAAPGSRTKDTRSEVAS